jgi:hypothetical protein
MFQRLFKSSKDCHVELTTQYRFNDDIMNLVNKTTSGLKLKKSDAAKEETNFLFPIKV